MGATPWGVSPLAGPAPINNSQITQATAQTGFPNAVDFGVGTSFQLTDVASFAAFTSAYDAYRINSVTLDIEYLNNAADSYGGTQMPTMYSYIDQDDDTRPLAIAALTQKQGRKIFQFGNKLKTRTRLRFTPVLANAVYAGPGAATGTAYAVIPSSKKPQWINCTDPSIPHYALKLWMTDLNDGILGGVFTQAFRLNWKYNVSFRSPLNCS